MDKTVAIVLNSPADLPEIEENDLLCADGGYTRVVGAQKNIFIIGDFDSLKAVPATIPHLTCPTDKNYTDGEKAIRYAAQKGYKKAVIYGADGGRMDMQLANLTLLKIAYDLQIDAEIVTVKERIFYTEKTIEVCSLPNKTVSVLPFGGEASFLSSEGLLYPLNGLTLTPSDTVGVSNKTTETKFSLTVRRGGALVFAEK